MDHQDAVRRGTIEKYVLNDIPQPERDEFEMHLFDCQECAEDVRTTATFLAEAKIELRRSPVARPARAVRNNPWFDLLRRPAVLLPVLVVLLLLALLITVILPRFAGGSAPMTNPQILTSLALNGSNPRDGAAPAATIAKGQPLLLAIYIPTAERFSSYACALVGPSGAVVWRLPVSAAQARDTLAISVPTGPLAPGNYRLLVQGHANAEADSVDLMSYRFTLNIAH